MSWGDLLKAKLHSIYLELQPEGSRRGSQNSAAGLGSIFHNLDLAWKKLILLSKYDPKIIFYSTPNLLKMQQRQDDNQEH